MDNRKIINEDQDFFSEIDAEKLNIDKTYYPAGSTVFAEGDHSHDVYILIKGTVSVYKSDKRIQTISKKGNIFGEISALLAKPRSATIKADEPCEIVKLTSEKLMKLMKAFPDLSIQLSKLLAQRLIWTTEKKIDTNIKN